MNDMDQPRTTTADHDHAAIGPCRQIIVKGQQIHLVETEGNLPVVCIHGSQAWGYTWRYQVNALKAARYRVILPDLPGCGYSDTDIEAASTEALSAFLGNLLDTLGIRRAFFVASSAGGLPTLDFAIRCPERVIGLILASTCGVSHLCWLIGSSECQDR